VETGKVKKEDVIFIMTQDVGKKKKYQPQIRRPLEHLELA
jgi:hypothetical protein